MEIVSYSKNYLEYSIKKFSYRHIHCFFKVLTNATPPTKGKNPSPAEMDMLFLVNGLGPKNDVVGLFGSWRGGGLCPAGRVGIEGSFLESINDCSLACLL